MWRQAEYNWVTSIHWAATATFSFHLWSQLFLVIFVSWYWVLTVTFLALLPPIYVLFSYALADKRHLQGMSTRLSRCRWYLFFADFFPFIGKSDMQSSLSKLSPYFDLRLCIFYIVWSFSMFLLFHLPGFGIHLLRDAHRCSSVLVLLPNCYQKHPKNFAILLREASNFFALTISLSLSVVFTKNLNMKYDQTTQEILNII